MRLPGVKISQLYAQNSSYSVTGELAMTWRLYITLCCITREEEKPCTELSLADFVDYRKACRKPQGRGMAVKESCWRIRIRMQTGTVQQNFLIVRFFGQQVRRQF